jgi:hypothetical protein
VKEKKDETNRKKEMNLLACAIYDLEVSPEHNGRKRPREKEQRKGFLSPFT